ncbi:MAG TPA: hypothetical protein VNE62_04695 [Actinomycetota bacterium]|nr:hypothetical protein [Actinomycetota bacterium]
MARVPSNPGEAVPQMDLSDGQTVLAVGPATAFLEALSEAVGEQGRVTVLDPPPDLEESPANVQVVEDLADDLTASVVMVWIGPVPAHSVREFAKRVADGGVFWVVFPKPGRSKMAPVNEADVKRALLAMGWRDNRSVILSADSYAMRFHKRG